MNYSIAHTNSPNKYIRGVNFALIGMIILSFFLKFLLILKHKIGWDEFYFLSKVHLYQNGKLTQPFQNFHVHLLGWLPWVSENEINQIILARFILFLLLILSGILFYRISRSFINRTGALIAILCWISLSNVIRHASSLRYDSFCSFIFLLACFTILKPRDKQIWTAIAGIFMGFSLLISIKAAIHLIALFALFVALAITASNKRFIFKELTVFTIFLFLTYSICFWIHKETLPSTIIPIQEDFLHNASSKAIYCTDFFPQLGFFYLTIFKNPATWLLFGIGIFFSIYQWIKTNKKTHFITLTFLIPLFSLPFYRNAYPYYYTSIIAPAFMFCGVLPHFIIEDFKKTGSRGLILIIAIICLPIICFSGPHYHKAFTQSNSHQVKLLTTIHKMFPDPVPYIDGCSAVASFPKVGFFMSTWGFENYLATGKPIFRSILINKQPQFLLADTPHLDFTPPRDEAFLKINYDFLEEDRKLLETNFIKYWGMIWLPGKILQLPIPNKGQQFDILIPGPYVNEGNDKIVIDGIIILPRSEILLKIGKHIAQSLGNSQTIILRWGNIKYIPSEPPPKMYTFYGF